MNAYSAIVEAFPAGVQVERFHDHLGHGVRFRIAGESRIAVEAEFERIRKIVAGREAWMRVVGPIYWLDEHVVHGELRERLDA
jgi:hypothetical protein